MEEQKPYEEPAVIFESDLEAQVAACGDVINNVYLGANNCKGTVACVVLYS